MHLPQRDRPNLKHLTRKIDYLEGKRYIIDLELANTKLKEQMLIAGNLKEELEGYRAQNEERRAKEAARLNMHLRNESMRLDTETEMKKARDLAAATTYVYSTPKEVGKSALAKYITQVRYNAMDVGFHAVHRKFRMLPLKQLDRTNGPYNLCKRSTLHIQLMFLFHIR